MDSLIRYVAAGGRHGIPGYEKYIEKIYRSLRFHDMIKNPLVDPASTRKCAEGVRDGERVISYQIVYNFTMYGITDTWYLTFDFYERGTQRQMQVDITSHTYRINIDEEYLLKLEKIIEECVEGDWEVFVRVYDRYSDMLNTLIAPEIHKTEESVRFVVYEIMRRAYGAQWWKEYEPGFFGEDGRLEADTAEDSHDGEYAVSDEYFLMMNMQDFYKVMSVEWEEYFAPYFTQEFLENMHRLAMGSRMVICNKRMNRENYGAIKAAIGYVRREAANILWKLEHTT